MDQGYVFEEVAGVCGGQLVVDPVQLGEVRLVRESLWIVFVYMVVLERKLVEFSCVVAGRRNYFVY